MVDSVIVIINGQPLAVWTKVSVNLAFGKASNVAKVTLTEKPSDPFPAQLNDKAVVIINGEPVVTGYVDDVDGSHDFGNHEINITVRDKTQDLIESTIGPKQEYKPPISLKDVASGTLKKMGLSDIKVVDNVCPEQFRPSEKVGGSIDTFGHDFLKNWANKRQVVLGTDGKGNLTIDRNQKKRGPGMLFKSFEDSPVNNVLSAQYKNSTKKRANKHSAAGQKSQTDRDWETKPKGVAEGQAGPMSQNIGDAFDTAMRPTRKIHYRGRQAIEGKTPKDAAAWKSNLARADGVTYEATVQGFNQVPGVLWRPGFIIPVRDDHFLLADDMFIKSVTLEKTWKGGSTTKISCTVKDAYTKDASEQPKSGGRGSKPGIGHSAAGRFNGADGGSFT
jgi:prophage tail gpP-like protein